MKILLASFLYESEIGGGAAIVLNQLAQRLLRANHEVVVLTTWAGSQVKAETVNEIKVIRLPASNLYWVADKDRQPVYKKIAWQLVDIWNPLIYRLAREILANEAPDIVHSHKLRGLSPSIWSAATSVGIKKIVHTCHDFELLSPEGLFMGKAGRLAREQNIVMRPYQSIRKYFSRLVHTATAPSRFVLDMHKRMGFFPLAKEKIISNTHGFEAQELERNISELSLLPEKGLAYRFLYIGRIDKAKGIDLLCQAFSRISAQNPDLILKIVGWGPMKELLSEKYKHQENIVFIGPAFGAQKVELFKDSDVLITPSVAPESFGLVIAEAYCYGLPVIATAVGAYPELVKNGETGFLVDPDSVEALSSVLLKIVDGRFRIGSFAGKCFDEARKFTVEKFIANYLDVYEDKI